MSEKMPSASPENNSDQAPVSRATSFQSWDGGNAPGSAETPMTDEEYAESLPRVDTLNDTPADEPGEDTFGQDARPVSDFIGRPEGDQPESAENTPTDNEPAVRTSRADGFQSWGVRDETPTENTPDDTAEPEAEPETAEDTMINREYAEGLPQWKPDKNPLKSSYDTALERHGGNNAEEDQETANESQEENAENPEATPEPARADEAGGETSEAPDQTGETQAEVATPASPETPEANESRERWYQRMNWHDFREMAKPLISAGASVAGLKGFYDVPEYLREKYMLRGGIYGGGLHGATSELLEANADQRAQTERFREINEEGINHFETRGEIYKQIKALEDAGEADTVEFRQLERTLEANQPTRVRKAIKDLNGRLSHTKEGMVRGSEARKQMADLLRAHRKAEAVDREKVQQEITSLLDDYTTQKVDGMTAAKEGLRTVLIGLGGRATAGIGTLALDAVGFRQEVKRTAEREGKEYTTKLLAQKFAEATRDNWQKLKGVDQTGEKSTARIWIDKMSAAAKFARIGLIASTVSLNSEVYDKELDKILEFNLDKVPANFADHISKYGEGIKSLSTKAFSFFADEAPPEVEVTAGGMPMDESFAEPPSTGGSELDKAQQAAMAQMNNDGNMMTGTTEETPATESDIDEKINALSEEDKARLFQRESVPPAGSEVVDLEQVENSPLQSVAEDADDLGEYKWYDNVKEEAPAEQPSSDSDEYRVKDGFTLKGHDPFSEVPEVKNEFMTEGAPTIDADSEHGKQLLDQTEGLYEDEFTAETNANMRALIAEIKETPTYDVNPGDNVWKIIENKLEAHDLFNGMEEGQRTHLIDELKDKVEAMSKEELKEFGISSGNAQLLSTEDVLDFSKIMGEEAVVEEAIYNAENLTEAQIKNIESYVPPETVAAGAAANEPEFAYPQEGSPTIPSDSEHAEMLRDQTGEFGQDTFGEASQEALRQTASVKAAYMAEDVINDLYGSTGVFESGIMGTKGVDSANWDGLKDVVAIDMMEKYDLRDFPQDDIFGDSIDQVGINSEAAVEGMYKTFEELMKETGLTPNEGETVDDFLHRLLEERAFSAASVGNTVEQVNTGEMPPAANDGSYAEEERPRYRQFKGRRIRIN